MTVSQANLDIIRKELAENPGGVLESVAAQHGVSLQTIIECLPGDMWRRIEGERFVEIMEELAGWGEILFLVHTPDIVFEVEGHIPLGTIGRGYYNLKGGSPIGGHLRADNCKAIILLRRPFMGNSESMSVQFFNANGGSMFKVFVRRDENRQLKADQAERFLQLFARCDQLESAE
ncbi:heme utilization cystosolic carrier protein HutX [Terrihabitans sp. B22-R8]|uniref:heme utilization cystosolic carrier protein HutX n=1 Tax=Terrihabitans sp. B22-R8 TaxID=3425128 RepID=UPI00403C997E